MTATAENVLVGGNGIISHAAAETTLPTTATSTLGGDWTDVGYISPDGVTQTIGRETTKIKAWQNGDTVREVQTSHDVQFTFSMLEHNDESVAIFYGDDNTATAIEITGDALPRRCYVIDVLDGDKTIRIAIPDAEIATTQDVSYKSETAIAYGVTITCYPDDSGVKAYVYMDDGEVS